MLRQSHFKSVTKSHLLNWTLIKSSRLHLEYVFVIRPHLEYAVPVWNPCLKRDIDMLGNMQRRATRLVPSLEKGKLWSKIESA